MGVGEALPTIMWLQTSQKVGFLKMCSWKAWALPPAPGCRPALVGVDARLPGAGRGLELGLPSAGTAGFASLLVRWKKLSALLLRKLLVLKESDRFSFWSCNAMTEHALTIDHADSRVGVASAPGTCPVPADRTRVPARVGRGQCLEGIWQLSPALLSRTTQGHPFEVPP